MNQKKRAGSVLAAILQNPDTLTDAFESAQNAEGSALRENEKYLDSIQGRMDLFTNAIQTMWANALDSGLVKWIVDVGTALVKVVDKLGVIPSILGAIAAYKFIFSKNKWDFASMLGIHSVEDGWFNRKTKNKLTNAGFFDAEKSSGNEFQLLINEKQRLQNELTNSQAQEDFLGKRLAAGYEDAAEAIDRVHIKNEQLKNQLNQIGNKFSSKYLNVFANGLAKGAVEKLTYDTKQLSGELDKLNGMDNAGIVNYMNNLDNLGDVGEDTKLVLAGYASTVKDGNYSLQGASEYVKNYNQNLAKLSKQSARARLSQMALNLAISVLTMIITNIITKLIDNSLRAKEEFDELSSKVSSTKSELSNIESELENTQKRIEELQNMDKLSFVDETELSRLKAVNEELKLQKGYKEAIQNQQQKGLNNASVKAAKDYYAKTGKDSGKTTEEKAGQGTTYGLMAGSVLAGGALAATGGAAGLAGALGIAGTTNVWNPAGWGLLIAASVIAIGAAIGAGIGAASGIMEEKVGESMDSMHEQYTKLQEEYNAAQSKYTQDSSDKNYKKMQKAQEKLTEYEATMANYLTEMGSYYSQIDLSVYDSIKDADEIARLRKEMNEFYDTQDKWLIESNSPDAKNNAFERIFGENAEQSIKYAKEQYIKALNDGEEISLEDAFGDNTEALEAFKARLYDMGLYVTDAERYLLDYKKTAEEAAEVNLYDLAGSVGAAEDAMSALKNAFEEANEAGQISAKTIQELSNTFGSIKGIEDEWEAYVNAMMSGVASTEEMIKVTEDLAEGWADQALIDGPLAVEEKVSLVASLARMGVENAYEYVEDAEKEAGYEAITKKISQKQFDKAELEKKKEDATDSKGNLDKTKFADTDQEMLDQLNTDLLNPEDTQWLKDEAAAYGITNEELQKNIDLLTQKAKKEKELEEINKHNADVNELNDTKSKIEEIDELISVSKNKKYTRTPGGQGTYSYQDEKGNNITEGEYNRWKQEYDELVKKRDELVKKRDELIKKRDELEARLDNNLEIQDSEQLQKEIDEINEQIKSEFTADIQLKLELQNKSQLIDDIQSVYDALKNAQKEYTENKYLSVDTMQSLLDLNPKYLTLLYDENGQLQLNEQALLRVAEARIIDMGISQQKAILEEGIKLATEGSRDALLEYISVIEDATAVNGSFVESQLAVIKSLLQARTIDRTETDENGNTVTIKADLSEVDAENIYKGIDSQIKAVQYTVDLGVRGLPKGGLSSSSSGGNDESELEKLQKEYERKISNLENQQTYIENEIEKLEANEEGVSKSYYEKQIELEEEKLDLYKQEREALLKLDMTDEVTSALWEVEHAIQESTLRMIEFRKSIIELYNTAFENIGAKFDDKGQLIDDAKSYLEGYMELFEIQGELAHPDMYDDLIAQEQNDKANNVAKLAAHQELYDQMMNSANPYATGSDDAKQYEEDRAAAAIQMQAEMRQTELAILDNDKALVQFNEDLKNLYIEGWDKVREAFDNKGSFIDNQLGYIESYIDRLETMNIDVPESAYNKMIAVQKGLNTDNQKQLDWEYAELERLKKELGEGDERYQAKLLEVAQLEKETYEGQTKVLEWEQKILDSRFEKFEQLISRIDDTINTLNNISDLMSDEDVAYEDGTWTAEGIARAGLAFQEMEMQKQIIEECNEQLAEQKRLLDKGEISQDKYYENTKSIEDAQWNAIKAYDAAEDSIIDLNETRIDMIESGIEKEISAMEELIQLKRDELDAERDLYDFKKNTEKELKNIAALERRIASMSGSTDAATIAERTKLEAELREARESLDDSYYDHAMTSQSNAYDDEMEAYEKNANDYLEKLRESIKETDLLIEATYTDVLVNGDIVLSQLTELSNMYGFEINTNLINPWINAAAQATLFKQNAEIDISSLINEGGIVSTFNTRATGLLQDVFQKASEKTDEFTTTVKNNLNGLYNEDGSITSFNKNATNLLTTLFGEGSKASNGFKTDVSNHINEIETFLNTESPKMQKYIDTPWNNASGEKGSLISFSDKVETLLEKAVADAKDTQEGQYGSLEGILEKPWDNAQNAVNNWYTNVESNLNNAITKAQSAAREIEAAYNVEPPSYVGTGSTGTGSTGTGSTGTGSTGTGSTGTEKDVKELQRILGEKVFGFAVKVTGKYDNATTEAVKRLQKVLKGTYYNGNIDGKYGKNTRSALQKYVNEAISSNNIKGTKAKAKTYFRNRSAFIPSAMYAKGTIGTKKDQWAITDEPQFGDELVLVPNKAGNLSFMRKGTGVVPATLTKEIMDIANVGLDGLMNTNKFGANINIISSAVNKPEIKLDIENFLRCDNVTQDSMPELKKFVNEQMNNLTKQLNYGLRRVGAK